jgi:anhydro-N-acetylmuramic acid kinase
VAHCWFQQIEGQWIGGIDQAKTYTFSTGLQSDLKNLPLSSALKMAETDATFARFSADCVLDFIELHNLHPTAVASHGHTIFHQPDLGFSTQIGNGGLMAARIGLPVVSDFRSTDVGYGGQGAPLVPGAERFLFSEFDACLNLGGIANISFPKSIPFSGFDLAPCNQLLNEAAAWLDLAFDDAGKLAAQGQAIPELMMSLDGLEFYKKKPPKSLGNESVAEIWKPLLSNYTDRVNDVLHTLCQHMAKKIAEQVLAQKASGKMLVTGGGAYNVHLMKEISRYLGSTWQIEIPDPQMISFKEAYCFAFLGCKRWLGQENCFAEVTGARKNSTSGAIYLP